MAEAENALPLEGADDVSPAIHGQQLLRQVMLVILPLFILVRVNKYYPFAAYLFKGLVRTVTPPTVALAALTDAKITTRDDGTVEDFKVPSNAQFNFQQQEVQYEEIFKLTFIDTLAEVCLLGAATLAAPFCTMAFNAITDKDAFELSAVSLLCLILLIDCLRVLFVMLKAGGKDELMMSLAVGFFVFAVTMVAWLAGGDRFDLGLDQEYLALEEHLRATVTGASEQRSKLKLPSIRFIKLATCMLGGALAGSLLLPAMREARCLRAASQHYDGNVMITLAHAISLSAPMGVFLTYIKPMQPLLVRALAAANMSPEQTMVALRLTLVAVLVISKLTLLRPYMQMFLNSAYQKATALFESGDETADKDADIRDKKEKKEKKAKQLRTSKGKKAAIKASGSKRGKLSAGLVQTTVENIWQYSAVVMLHLLLPIVLFAGLGLSIALRGGFSQLALDSTSPAPPRTLSMAYADLSLCWLSIAWWSLSAGCYAMLQAMEAAA